MPVMATNNLPFHGEPAEAVCSSALRKLAMRTALVATAFLVVGIVLSAAAQNAANEQNAANQQTASKQSSGCGPNAMSDKTSQGSPRAASPTWRKFLKP
jgi:hypothetical protein